MDPYRKALAAFLEPKDRTQDWLARSIGRTQAAVNRYVNGERFPDLETARRIEEASEGAVPVAAWQAVAMERLGINDHSAAEAA